MEPQSLCPRRTDVAERRPCWIDRNHRYQFAVCVSGLEELTLTLLTQR
jgi:hypothetical protein